MWLDSDGIPRLIQNVKYRSGPRLFVIEWFDGVINIVTAERACYDRALDHFFYARGKWQINYWDMIVPHLEKLYPERKTLQQWRMDSSEI